MSIIQGTSKAAGGGYTIDQSLRLDGTGDMSRTVGSDGNLRKWTFAFWLKRTAFGTNGGLGFNVGGTYVDGDNRSIFRFYSGIAGGDDDWYWAERSGAAWREDQATSIMYRDPSAWAHYMCVWDTDGGTTPRARRYVNGVSVDSDLKSGGTLAAANVDSGTNKAGTFQLFDQPGFPGREYEGYCADMYFLDGIAATPADFGTLDAGTGRFLPKEYTGSFGSNGFYLDFADSADLGKDVSGNGNHFTTSSLSSSAQVSDSPTDSFCTWSGSDLRPATSGTQPTYGNGNLEITGGFDTASFGTMFVSSGKWYFEFTATTAAASANHIGIISRSAVHTADLYDNIGGSHTLSGEVYSIRSTDGYKWSDGASAPYGSAWGAVTVSVALDLDNQKVWFGPSGTYPNSGDPAAGTNAAFNTLTSGESFSIFHHTFNLGLGSVNCGQQPFVYTPPTGFNPWSTAVLDDTTITTSGSFTGNASADGPFIYLNGVPTAMTINGNSVTFGTHVDKLANGFKVRTSSSSYNASGSNSYSISTTGAAFADNANAQGNP